MYLGKNDSSQTYMDNYINKNVIVTGGYGAIGLKVVKKLMKANVENLVIFDRGSQKSQGEAVIALAQ